MKTMFRTMLAVSALLLAACGGARTDTQRSSLAPASGRVTLITSEMIVQMSAETAWDVIQRRAPEAAYYLNGRRLSSASGRGPSEPPLVVIDGMPVMDPRSLVLIRASDVRAIRILGGTDGSIIHGPRASGGAIEVVTKG